MPSKLRQCHRTTPFFQHALSAGWFPDIPHKPTSVLLQCHLLPDPQTFAMPAALLRPTSQTSAMPSDFAFFRHALSAGQLPCPQDLTTRLSAMPSEIADGRFRSVGSPTPPHHPPPKLSQCHQTRPILRQILLTGQLPNPQDLTTQISAMPSEIAIFPTGTFDW